MRRIREEKVQQQQQQYQQQHQQPNQNNTPQRGSLSHNHSQSFSSKPKDLGNMSSEEVVRIITEDVAEKLRLESAERKREKEVSFAHIFFLKYVIK